MAALAASSRSLRLRFSDAFNGSRNHEKIVHYAGAQKPWKDLTNCDRFGLYWEYAKDTPILRSADRYLPYQNS